MSRSRGCRHTSSPSRRVPSTKKASGASTSTSYMCRERSIISATGAGAAAVEPGRSVSRRL